MALLDKISPEARAALGSLFSSPAWTYFELLEKELEQSKMNEMVSLDDPISIYRAQGQIEGMRALLGFKDTLSPKRPQFR